MWEAGGGGEDAESEVGKKDSRIGENATLSYACQVDKDIFFKIICWARDKVLSICILSGLFLLG